MSEWKDCKIGDFCRYVCSGGTPKSSVSAYYNEGTIPWLNTKEIHGDQIFKTERYITELGLKNSSAKWIKANCVVVAMYGATAGQVAVVKIPVTTNQACCNLEIDSEKADYRFVYYSLRNSYRALSGLANGGAQQNLNAQIIKDFQIVAPSLTTQRKIAAVLGALDDKIELNRKMNANLEAMAQALFKSWFVDFEPFGGKMPEGWKTSRSGDFFDITIGKTPPRKEPEWFAELHGENSVWASIANMGDCGMFLSDSSEYLTPAAVEKFNLVKVPKDTVLLSFKLTVGRVAIAGCELTTNEAIAHFKTEDKRLREYTYLYLKAFKYAELGSTSSIATAVNSKMIRDMPFVMPDEETLAKFQSIVRPLFDKVGVSQDQSRTLAQLRDALLPKLMSGELDVETVKVEA